MKIPDGLPTLSSGAHNPGSGKACFMEYASLLAGESWSDRPSCTHPVIASMARVVNDRLPNSERSRLAVLIPSVIGTADLREDEMERRSRAYEAMHGGSAMEAALWLATAEDAWTEPDGAREPWQVTDAAHVHRHSPDWYRVAQAGRAS